MKPFKIILFIFLVSIVNFSVFAQIRDLSPGLSHIQNGDNKMRINDWEGAALEYTTAIKIDPNLADAYYKRSIVYAKLARLKEAEEDRRRALTMNPKIEKFYDDRSILSMMILDYGNATGDFMETFILQPMLPVLFAEDDSSDYALMLKNSDINFINTFLEKQKDDTTALLQRALLLIKDENYESALKDINESIRLKTKNAKAFEIRGLVQLRVGNYLFAVDDLSKSIEFNSLSAVAWFNRGLARLLKQDHPGALYDFLKTLQINDTAWEAAYNSGMLKMKMERYSDANLDFDKAIRINSTIGYIFFYRGISRYKISAFQGAFDDFERSWQLGTYRKEAMNNRAILHAFFNEPKEGIKDLSLSISEDDDYALAYYNRGISNILIQLRIKACLDFEHSKMLNFLPAEAAHVDFCEF